MGKVNESTRSTARQSTALDRHIGARVRLARELNGVSQERLGEELGITFQQVQKYERGTNRIAASRLHVIACFLLRPLEFFYEGFSEEAVAVVPTSLEDRELAQMGVHSARLQAAITSLGRLPRPVQKSIMGLIHDLDDDRTETESTAAD